MIDRRRALAFAAATLAGSGTVRAQSAANQWFAVKGDDGRPVPNARAPAELVEDIEDLSGAIWSGPAGASVKLVEFYDYNCPWCRAADKARVEVRRGEADLRIGLVHNPILSPASVAAAKVDLALLALKGARASYELHERLFSSAGRLDGERALAAASELGHDRAALAGASASPEIERSLRQGMRLAASLGIVATPSYVVGGAVVLGFPGDQTLARIVADARRCGQIAC